jgi:hypothetical protein
MLSLWVLVIQQAERNKIVKLSQESSTVCLLIYYVTGLLWMLNPIKTLSFNYICIKFIHHSPKI